MTTSRRVLLVSPKFHGYWRSIARALQARGHQVRGHAYDDRAPSARVAHKLLRELPARIGATARRDTSTTTRTVEVLRQWRPEVVVVVRGDELGEDFWEEVQRLPRVLWLYDELRRTAWTSESLARVGPVATYSAHDAQALGARHLPLAYDPGIADVRDVPRREDVVFVGARYPSREKVLLALRDAGVPVRVYGRDWSRHVVDRLRTWGGPRPDLPAGRDLSRAESYRTMAGAAGALNLHSDQDGFTMRTFEACGVGGLQLLDRTDVTELYEPGRELLTFTGPEELVEHVARAGRDPRWAEAIRDRGRERTLAEHTFDRRVAVLEDLWSA